MQTRRTIKILLLICLMASGYNSQGQETVYRLNKAYDPVVTASSAAAGFLALYITRDKEPPGVSAIQSLSQGDVWKPDRWVFDQSVSFRGQAATLSDIGAGITFAAPALLLIGKDLRKEWLELIVLYTESQLVGFNLMQWSKALSNRYRPVTYFEELPMDEKDLPDNLNSFYSGHTTITSTASFFMAKVICDFHPELGKKRYLIYAAAVIPPALVGAMRIRALKHFPTDMVAGIATGALAGILIPHLHKSEKRTRTGFYPVFGNYQGLVVNISF